MSNKKNSDYFTSDGIPFHRQDREKRRLSKQRKPFKRNRKDTTRRKNWMPDDDDDWDTIPDERIMPRDELDRRLMVSTHDTPDEPEDDNPPQSERTDLRGYVTEVSSSLCRVLLDGAEVVCRLRGSLTAFETGFTNVVAVGDEVLVAHDGHDKFVIEMVLPRRSWLARPDTFLPDRRQIIVANADQLLIVTSWRQPNLWTELVDRYLITAARDKLEPIICLNKIDLVEDESELDEFQDVYGQLVEKVILSSTVTGAGLDELGRVLKGKTTVLAGLSGVGKSSLLTAINPEFDLRTGAVSDFSRQGQHTTTQARMLPFGDDGFVIDTPGIREYGLSGFGRGDLAGFYPEIADVMLGCRFTDCTHNGEPDCAVQEAVKTGYIPRWRYENYRKIYDSLPA